MAQPDVQGSLYNVFYNFLQVQLYELLQEYAMFEMQSRGAREIYW